MSRRALTTMLLLAGAALVAGAALLRWATADYTDQLRGPVSVVADGRTLVPALLPLAVASVAGWGALLASRGWWRRIIGVLIVGVGAGVTVLAVRGLVHDPTAELIPATATAGFGMAQRSPFGPILALAGGLLLVAAGLLAIVGPGGAAALGSRYDRTPVAPGDDDQRLWRELDAARDPTAD